MAMIRSSGRNEALGESSGKAPDGSARAVRRSQAPDRDRPRGGWPGSVRTTRATQAAWALPAQPSVLIGRAAELASARAVRLLR